jgi:hypothetical protein
MGALTRNGQDPKGSLLDEETKAIRWMRDASQLRQASFVRFHSPDVSFCRLHIAFTDPRLCHWWLPQASETMGTLLVLGPTPPHGPQHSAVQFIYQTDAGKTVVRLADDGQRCANEFSITSYGTWK